MKFRDLALKGPGKQYENALVQLENSTIRPRSPGVPSSTHNASFNDVKFENSGAGIRSRGNLPKNLSVTGSTFNNVEEGIILSRDARVGANHNGLRDGMNGKGEFDFTAGGTLDINDNKFFGRQRFAIGIDAGNDGKNVDPAPGFDFSQSDIRSRFNDKTTVYDSVNISGNEIDGASEFGIALATVQGSKAQPINVSDNDIKLTGVVEYGFNAGINIEHNAAHINVNNNRINLSKTLNGGEQVHGIAISPFHDHGATASTKQGSGNINVSNNFIWGEGRTGVYAFGSKQTTIDNNTFNSYTYGTPNHRVFTARKFDISIIDPHDGFSDVVVSKEGGEYKSGKSEDEPSFDRHKQTREEAIDPTRGTRS